MRVLVVQVRRVRVAVPDRLMRVGVAVFARYGRFMRVRVVAVAVAVAMFVFHGSMRMAVSVLLEREEVCPGQHYGKRCPKHRGRGLPENHLDFIIIRIYNKFMIYEWDERKRQSNIRKHGLDFEDVAEVFDDSHGIEIIDDNGYGEEIKKTKSRTDWDRVLNMKDEDIIMDEDAPDIIEGLKSGRMQVRGRPRREDRKVPISIRLEPDTVASLRESGPGWQTKLSEKISEWAKENALN
jgi:uncharacterized protein (DUF4415 family)